MSKTNFTFIDLFAGIGGFHIALNRIGGECVFASEWDVQAMKTYMLNFIDVSPKMFHDGNFRGDITKVRTDEIPDFNILTGGFPCQPFSQAGKKLGFSEARGTLFFDIARIIEDKKPEAFFIENVRGLRTHDDGKTFTTIKNIIENDLGYSFYYKVIKASDFGLPQNRPRLFMVGFRDKNIAFNFPKSKPLNMTMDDVFNGVVNRRIGYTLRLGGKGSGLHDRRNWDTYIVDGIERRLTPKEALKMQGFPESFKFPVTNNQAMMQLGNSVAIPAIQATAKEIVKRLNTP